MTAREIAPGVVHLPLTLRASINAYLLGDVLVDAGTRHDAKRILRALRGSDVRAHALTHVHPDHQGATHRVCAELGLPLAVAEGEAAQMEAGEQAGAADPTGPARVMRAVAGGPGHPVARTLREGDEVGGFTVLSTPGHSPDHIAYWRESDRVLIAGDALRNMSYATLGPKFALPYDGFNFDQDAVVASARRLVELRPRVAAFGHGAPMDGDAFARAAESLL